MQLTSANSINVARWLPQQLYYFFALQQWNEKKSFPVIAVPSGNFGNICAGLVAYLSGLPITHFIAACNINDAVPNYLRTGTYQAKNAMATISNAMDVGSPSNFIRILEMFKNNHTQISQIISGYSITDLETISTISQVFNTSKYILDPHGAVAYNALEQYLSNHQNQKGIILETAHPIKFPETLESSIGQLLDIPDSAKNLFGKEKHSVLMNADFDELKNYLLSR
jgi:threonine synthase